MRCFYERVRGRRINCTILKRTKKVVAMNEFLLLALVAIYLTISYPPKSKQPNSNNGERTRRLFALIGKKRA
jgi:hypothetical protein